MHALHKVSRIKGPEQEVSALPPTLASRSSLYGDMGLSCSFWTPHLVQVESTGAQAAEVRPSGAALSDYLMSSSPKLPQTQPLLFRVFPPLLLKELFLYLCHCPLFSIFSPHPSSPMNIFTFLLQKLLCV